MKYIHVTYYYSPESVKIQYEVFYLSQTKREINYYYEKATVTISSEKRVRNLYNQHRTLVIEFYLIISFCFKLTICLKKKFLKLLRIDILLLLE